MLHIDSFVSKPHNFIFLNVQERQDTDRQPSYFNVLQFDIDELQF